MQPPQSHHRPARCNTNNHIAGAPPPAPAAVQWTGCGLVQCTARIPPLVPPTPRRLPACDHPRLPCETSRSSRACHCSCHDRCTHQRDGINAAAPRHRSSSKDVYCPRSRCCCCGRCCAAGGAIPTADWVDHTMKQLPAAQRGGLKKEHASRAAARQTPQGGQEPERPPRWQVGSRRWRVAQRWKERWKGVWSVGGTVGTPPCCCCCACVCACRHAPSRRWWQATNINNHPVTSHTRCHRRTWLLLMLVPGPGAAVVHATMPPPPTAVQWYNGYACTRRRARAHTYQKSSRGSGGGNATSTAHCTHASAPAVVIIAGARVLMACVGLTVQRVRNLNCCWVCSFRRRDNRHRDRRGGKLAI